MFPNLRYQDIQLLFEGSKFSSDLRSNGMGKIGRQAFPESPIQLTRPTVSRLRFAVTILLVGLCSVFIYLYTYSFLCYEFHLSEVYQKVNSLGHAKCMSLEDVHVNV